MEGKVKKKRQERKGKNERKRKKKQLTVKRASVGGHAKISTTDAPDRRDRMGRGLGTQSPQQYKALLPIWQLSASSSLNILNS